MSYNDTPPMGGVGVLLIGGLAVALSMQKCNNNNFKVDEEQRLTNNRRSQLLEGVERLADLDGDENGVTSHQEWEKVYNKLCIGYNSATADPWKDLTITQMENYISENAGDSFIRDFYLRNSSN